MAKYSIEDSTLTAIADSIRLSKGEFSARHKVSDMPKAIYTEDTPKTLGQMVCLARIKQLRDITLVPVLDLPYNHGVRPAGEPTTGIPYSSVRLTDKFVGFNVSIHTFMTALHNPKSVLYTRTYPEFYDGPNAVCWYGLNCSVFLCYAWGLPYHSATAALPTLDCVEPVAPEDMQLCDGMVSNYAGHAQIISGIIRNADGSIKEIELSESGSYGTKKRSLISYADFVSYYIVEEKYTIYRNKLLYEANYEPCKFIPLFDEPSEEIVYSDLCTDLGDRACINSDETITLNPIKTSGYTGINLYKDGVLLNTYAVGDVELSGLEAGKYEARLVPEGDNASTSFIVCDVKAWREGTRYYFSGTGGIPHRVVLKDNLGYTLKVYELSEDDIRLGYKDIEWTHEVLDHFCVPFKNDYGFVVAKTVWAEPEPEIVLPDEYKLVEYIESDGAQYIDTGINPAVSLADGAIYYNQLIVTQYLSGNVYVYGSLAGGERSANFRTNGGTSFGWYTGGASNPVGATTIPESQLPIGAMLTTRYTVDNVNKTATDEMTTDYGLGSTGSRTFTGDATPDGSIYLFYCRGVSSTAKYPCKMIRFTISNLAGGAVQDLVPCYRKADGVVGMFDLVSNTFFVNAGSGSFTKGADV